MIGDIILPIVSSVAGVVTAAITVWLKTKKRRSTTKVKIKAKDGNIDYEIMLSKIDDLVKQIEDLKAAQRFLDEVRSDDEST